MRNFVRAVSSLVILGVLAVSGITGYYMYSLPDSFYVSRGTNLKLSCQFDITANESEAIKSVQSGGEKYMGNEVTLKLFGLVPIKTVSVSEVDRPVLVPGGNPFGIKIITEGVIVIGVSEVDSCDGSICPASTSGILVGDVIISINGKKITSNSAIEEAITKSQGEDVIVKLKRDSKVIEIILTPAYSLSEACFRAGMYVRDSSAGIGTITFYDPETEMFGGLGHPVCDVDTGEILPLHSGEVVAVTINGLHKGQPGHPGELVGSFVSSLSIGSLLLNNQSGLFGELDSAPNSSPAIPMAYRQEITEGHATILTTLKGNSPKEYDIEIESINYKGGEEFKNMVIKVTDTELLEQAGGILQGMSGSPILQNGKIVGAVTHVFVNDPTKGYGIFVDTMYNYSLKVIQNAA
ncbi:MAG: SpoIVB peptidase [Oscillospiraceae bacterium]|jgi:stage IV sporulation protein B